MRRRSGLEVFGISPLLLRIPVIPNTSSTLFYWYFLSWSEHLILSSRYLRRKNDDSKCYPFYPEKNIAHVIPDVDCANCVPLLKECNVFWYAILQVRLQILESSIRVNTVRIFHANAFLPCQLFFLVDVIISGFWIIINYRPFDLGKFGMLASEAYCAWLMWLNIVPDEFCNMWSIRTLDDEFYQNL